ncbi:MAG TPA: endo-1,4-beta-xylanase, partial [Flavisolibacter sp.]|nr:endo-1,4-beta-xylanase [Flavisolibacter sp.]
MKEQRKKVRKGLLKLFINSAVGVLCLTSLNSMAQQKVSDKTLKDVYKDAFLMGVAVTPAITSGRDKASQDIVIKHFNSITVENVMKAALVNPEPGVYNWGPADDFVAFGEKHNMFIIGHTLVWHNQVPAWFFTNAEGKPNTKEEQIERMR